MDEPKSQCVAGSAFVAMLVAAYDLGQHTGSLTTTGAHHSLLGETLAGTAELEEHQTVKEMHAMTAQAMLEDEAALWVTHDQLRQACKTAGIPEVFEHFIRSLEQRERLQRCNLLGERQTNAPAGTRH